MQKFAFWVERCIKSPNIEVVLCGKIISETFRPPLPTSPHIEVNFYVKNKKVPKFPTYRGYTLVNKYYSICVLINAFEARSQPKSSLFGLTVYVDQISSFIIRLETE